MASENDKKVRTLCHKGRQIDADLIAGVTATAAELNLLDTATAGTVVASKALIVGANKNLDTLTIADSGLKLGAGAGTAVTSTAAELNLLDGLVAPGVDGASIVRVAQATYDFAEHGGAVGAIDLGVTIPDNAIILDGMVDVITTCTTAGADAGTMAIHVEGAGDIVAAVAVSAAADWDAGLRPIIPANTSITAVKTAAPRQVTATIAVQDFTAGKFIVYLRYVQSV